jgi:hypothetical protein
MELYSCVSGGKLPFDRLFIPVPILLPRPDLFPQLWQRVYPAV